MRYDVRITQAAWADVEAIYAWMEQEGAPLAAGRWFNGWLEELQNLRALAEGRPLAPENGGIPGVEIHQQLYGDFRTLYIIREACVFVVHVRRARRGAANPEDLSGGLEEAQAVEPGQRRSWKGADGGES